MADSAMLPDAERRAIDRYLALADRLLPGRVAGFYVVGSAALGAYRPGRSDIDFIAVVEGDFNSVEVRQLRLLHILAGGRNAVVTTAARRSPLSGTCNGVFVRAADLTKPVTQITPVASHNGHVFCVGRGFDCNPVTWRVLAERGIALRGPTPQTLGLDPQPHLLGQWNLANLHDYWELWAQRTLAGGDRLDWRVRPRWNTAWGVLGPPRLHATIATGQVLSKDAAGQYALATFDLSWHPIIHEALAVLRGEHADPAFRNLATRSRQVTEFVMEVVRSADVLNPGPPAVGGR